MIFIDMALWLIVAKIVVVLLEDTAYAVRGQQSPRQRERAKERAATATGQQLPIPVRGWERTRAAVGGYLAGVVEDATAAARGHRRRSLARKRGRRAVDGVFVDVDEDGSFTADCDLCGWSSRQFRIEANAQFAGREHTRTEHPEQYHEDPATEPIPQPEPGSPVEPAPRPAPSGDGGPDPDRPKLRVIPGGAADSDEDTAPAQKPTGGPTPAQPGPVSGATPTADAAITPAAPTPPEPVAGTDADAAPQDDGDPLQGGWVLSDEERRRAFASLFARCVQPSTKNENGTCGLRTALNSDLCLWHLLQQAEQPASATPAASIGDTTADALANLSDLAGKTPANETGTGIPAGATTTKENTVNLEATGPDEIRSAFTEADAEAETRAEELAGIAGILSEAADRFEQMQMAGSTVDHLREASESFAAAHAALNTAQEQLQSALADFNSKDGLVADTAADVGNLASQEVLVGS